MTTILVRVVPNAKRTEVAGKLENTWKIRLAAPPIDGRANDVLIAFLAELFACKQKEIHLVSGGFSRLKRVQIPVTMEEAEDVLNAASR